MKLNFQRTTFVNDERNRLVVKIMSINKIKRPRTSARLWVTFTTRCLIISLQVWSCQMDDRRPIASYGPTKCVAVAVGPIRSWRRPSVNYINTSISRDATRRPLQMGDKGVEDGFEGKISYDVRQGTWVSGAEGSRTVLLNNTAAIHGIRRPKQILTDGIHSNDWTRSPSPRHGRPWKGERGTAERAKDWPRASIVVDTVRGALCRNSSSVEQYFAVKLNPTADRHSDSLYIGLSLTRRST